MFLQKLIKKLFKRNPKWFLLNNEYKIVEAFTHQNETYYMYEDIFKAATGRAIAAIAIYEEFRMKCDVEYLKKHVKAIDHLMNQEKIKLTVIWEIHNNLKERLNIVAFPDHIYKLASVIFFDKSESPYGYDFDYNNKKIKKWKEDGQMLDFFLRTPLKTLMPLHELPTDSAKMFLEVADKVDKRHLERLHQVLSSWESTTAGSS